MSDLPRLFDGSLAGAPGELSLSEAQRHHLVHVLRLREGDRFELFDGRGNVYPACLLASSRATLDPPLRLELPTPVTLLQALPKADKLEWILQKGAELGASAFVVFPSARSVARFPADRIDAKAERWRKILEEAARQCRRADLPALQLVPSLEEALKILPPGTGLWLLDEEEPSTRLGSALALHPAGAPIAIAVGPEGGWERAEVAAARSAGTQTVSLGRRILRTETAGLAGLAIALHRAGELG